MATRRRHARDRVRPSGLVSSVWLAAMLVLFGSSTSTGCEPRRFSDGLPRELTCSSCHGNENNAAPPKAINGSSSTSDLGVGAHQTHLRAGSISKPVACEECHPVPAGWDEEDHPNLAIDMAFGSLAHQLGAAPTWDRGLARCLNTYCHGATLRDADARPAPIWTRVDGTQLACNSCHGDPPGGTHPAGDKCEACHGEVITGDRSFKAIELHVDGIVQATDGGHPAGYGDPNAHGPDTKMGKSDCRACHGETLEGKNGVSGCDSCHRSGWRTQCEYCHGGTDPSSGAPPRDLSGADAVSSVTNGAHTEHVTKTSHRSYSCNECHPEVKDVLTPGHLFDETPGESEVDFSRGLSPQGRYAQPACSELYCHGTGLVAGSAASFVPGTALGCSSCHPAETQSPSHAAHGFMICADCHASVVDNSSRAITDANLHVNGSVEVSMPTGGTWDRGAKTCAGAENACHGSEPVGW